MRPSRGIGILVEVLPAHRLHGDAHERRVGGTRGHAVDRDAAVAAELDAALDRPDDEQLLRRWVAVPHGLRMGFAEPAELDGIVDPEEARG
jgi:hypothetical protein